MKVFPPLFLASIMAAPAVEPTISTLSIGDRTQLMMELAAKGLLPIPVESALIDDHLQRFYNHKLDATTPKPTSARANPGGCIRLERGVGGVGTCNVVDVMSYPKLSPTKPATSPSTPPRSKPSTTKGETAKPPPTTAGPSLCGPCTACCYPDGDSRYNDFTKPDYNYYSSGDGAIWCGNRCP